MATIADELNAISVEHGYTGAAPKTIAGAIDALADTLAGTDVEGKRTIAGAVKALAPYIGSGGGGTTLGAMVYIESQSSSAVNFSVSTMAYDISGDTTDEVRGSIYNNTNVCGAESLILSAPSGCYIVIETAVPSEWSTDSVEVFVGEETASDFECRKLHDDLSTYYYAYLTMQIPDDNLNVNFNLS